MSRNIPENYKIIEENQDAKYAIYADLDNLTACLFTGRKKNPTWHYRFKSEEQFNTYITKEVESLEKRYADQVERENAMKQRAIEEAEKVQVGDIYVYSWGWEQTNVNFYQVVEKPSPKTLVVREVRCESIEEASWASDYVKPVKDGFINEDTERVRLNKWGGFTRSCGTASRIEVENSRHYRSWYA